MNPLLPQGRQAVFDKHVEVIKRIIRDSGEVLEGNCVYHHDTLIRAPALKNKQVNLFNAGAVAKTSLAEIGFNAGHSALLFLLSAPPEVRFTFFDLGEHAYALPCFEYLQSEFPDRHMEFHKGDSRITLPSFIHNNPDKKFDVIHVDGGHTHEVIVNDLGAALQLSRPGSLLFIDDTNTEMLKAGVDNIVAAGWCKEDVQMLPTIIYEHRILTRL
jgi:predicted O-methyltransferase YrrM